MAESCGYWGKETSQIKNSDGRQGSWACTGVSFDYFATKFEECGLKGSARQKIVADIFWRWRRRLIQFETRNFFRNRQWWPQWRATGAASSPAGWAATSCSATSATTPETWTSWPDSRSSPELLSMKVKDLSMATGHMEPISFLIMVCIGLGPLGFKA